MNDESFLLNICSLFLTKVKGQIKDQGNWKGLKAAIDELRKGERVTSASAEETYNFK
jgi:ATP-dependent Clp protease ATP-binding subunit ClpB